tara:strand:- start:84 stop:344 length:261 start_codon:yes stop_codon:yes gene_type:complete
MTTEQITEDFLAFMDTFYPDETERKDLFAKVEALVDGQPVIEGLMLAFIFDWHRGSRKDPDVRGLIKFMEKLNEGCEEDDGGEVQS